MRKQECLLYLVYSALDTQVLKKYERGEPGEVALKVQAPEQQYFRFSANTENPQTEIQNPIAQTQEIPRSISLLQITKSPAIYPPHAKTSPQASIARHKLQNHGPARPSVLILERVKLIQTPPSMTTIHKARDLQSQQQRRHRS